MAALRSSAPIFEQVLSDDNASLYGMVGAMKAALAMGATHFEIVISDPRDERVPVHAPRERDSLLSYLYMDPPQVVGSRVVTKRTLFCYAVRAEVTP